MITKAGFDCYKKYIAIKTHFNSDYDYFKHKGKSRISEEAYLNRRDLLFFEITAQKYDDKKQIAFFVSNFLMNNGLWIGDATSEKCHEIYLEFSGRLSRLHYEFESDMRFLVNYCEKANLPFSKLFISRKGQYPLLLQFCFGKEICLETILILDYFYEFLNTWKEKIRDRVIYPGFHQKLLRYSRFCVIKDDNKYSDVIIGLMKNLEN